MSRIEEALRRARQGSEEPADEPAPATEGETQVPWSFDTTAEPATATRITHPGRPALPPPPTVVPTRSGRSQDTQAHLQNVAGAFHGFDEAVKERVITSSLAPSVSVEQYRKLAATLHHAQADRGIKRLLITSATAGEGKSLTSTNLALTLGQSYHRNVLLIDGDLRRPTLHQIFQVQNVSGLTEGLRATGDGKLSLVEVSPHLTLLTAGQPDPDPMSALVSERMRRILDEASARFDWIIFDSPPVALLPDANLLAAMVDSVLIVVDSSSSPFELVQKAVQAVDRTKVMGVILNRVSPDELRSDPYDHYYGRAPKRD